MYGSGRTKYKGLLWSGLAFMANMLSLGVEISEGHQIFHCQVGVKVSQSLLLSMNGVAILSVCHHKWM
jgi:hypothetical protein